MRPKCGRVERSAGEREIGMKCGRVERSAGEREIGMKCGRVERSAGELGIGMKCGRVERPVNTVKHIHPMLMNFQLGGCSLSPTSVPPAPASQSCVMSELV